MKFTVTYDVNGRKFKAESESLAETYENVKAIIQREKLLFSDTDAALSGYMEILANMATGNLIRHSNAAFRIERTVTA